MSIIPPDTLQFVASNISTVLLGTLLLVLVMIFTSMLWRAVAAQREDSRA